MMAILWYYRPEQTDCERMPRTEENEIFASRHHDVIPVECIDDKAYVLTLSEYCRRVLSSITIPTTFNMNLILFCLLTL